jgi:hypothetical protein
MALGGRGHSVPLDHASGEIIPGCQAGSQTTSRSTREMPSPHRVANAIADDLLHWAAGRRERVRHIRDVSQQLDVVDQSERYDVEPELRIDDGAERGPDRAFASIELAHVTNIIVGARHWRDCCHRSAGGSRRPSRFT